MKVLYFEDKPTMNTFISGKLEQEGYELYSMLSLGDTLEWLDEGIKPDLALLDIKESARIDPFTRETIPEDPEAGFKIAARLMEIDKNMPIVFLTGYDNEEEVRNKARTFGPIEIFGKGKPGVGELNDSITKKVLSKINKVLESKRDIDPAEQRFGKAFGRKIAVEKKNKSFGSTFYVIDTDDVMAVEYKNEPLRDEIEITESNFKNELGKLIHRELKDIINLLPVSEEVYADMDHVKTLPGDHPDRKKLNPAVRKYAENCLLFLQKNGRQFFRYAGGSDWMETEVDDELKAVTEKNKNKWGKEDKACFKQFMDIMLDKISIRSNDDPGWEEIEKETFYRIYNESLNPIFLTEILSRKSELVDQILIKTVDRQFLELTTLRDEDYPEKQKIFNVSLSSFEEQTNALNRLKQVTNDSPYIKLSGNVIVNGNAIDSFSESAVVLSNGQSISIKQTAFNNLRMLFPTLKTK